MENKEAEQFLTAYRQGTTVDFLQTGTSGRWGTLWTITPCDPDAAERAGRQMVRMGTEVRWIRRARLCDARGQIEVFVVLTLPDEKQTVILLSTGAELKIDCLLVDASYIALKTAFMHALTNISTSSVS